MPKSICQYFIKMVANFWVEKKVPNYFTDWNANVSITFFEFDNTTSSSNSTKRRRWIRHCRINVVVLLYLTPSYQWCRIVVFDEMETLKKSSVCMHCPSSWCVPIYESWKLHQWILMTHQKVSLPLSLHNESLHTYGFWKLHFHCNRRVHYTFWHLLL